MKSPQKLEPEFVDFIPSQVDDGKLYVSMQYGTVVHNCCCGCGNKVVTPLTPNDWKLTYDGESVSISPSIGNWSFPCQSHYWIRRSSIEWSGKWSIEKIEMGRQLDREKKKKRYAALPQPAVAELLVEKQEVHVSTSSVSWWSKLKRRLQTLF
ncbi:hypothetical protein GCM10023185_41950 [Hymenobacter saemangeumensis]|uniref:Intein C-terminal splicing domain-containing protein n=1 Tax=Hymenobacter saemangeumensis TaxID=1084522 RepID=A0ABP8ISU7_9BACT